MSDLNLQFQLECKETQLGEEIYIVGNSNELGNWNVNHSKKLSTDSKRFPLWESNPINFQSKSKLEYKYIIKGSNNVKWENFDGNRSINISSLENSLYVVNDGKFSSKTNPKINKSNDINIQPQPEIQKNRPKKTKSKNLVKKKSSKIHKVHHNNYQYSN